MATSSTSDSMCKVFETAEPNKTTPRRPYVEKFINRANRRRPYQPAGKYHATNAVRHSCSVPLLPVLIGPPAVLSR